MTPRQQDSPWLETSHRFGYKIESLLRGGQHLGLTRQWLSPRVIADWIWKAHFACNRLSEFEKHVMRRVVPFYTFTSRNVPLQPAPRLPKKSELVLHKSSLCSFVKYEGRRRGDSGCDNWQAVESLDRHNRELHSDGTLPVCLDGVLIWRATLSSHQSSFEIARGINGGRCSPKCAVTDICLSPGNNLHPNPVSLRPNLVAMETSSP